MRIIAGQYKGRRLHSPEDDLIRPTTDRMRETLFNMLGHGPSAPYFQGNVLDLYAGTGTLGLECLSRGAVHVTFVDNNPTAIRLIRQNVKLLKAEDRTSVKSIDVLKLPRATRPFATIFLDPPYHKGLMLPSLTHLLQAGYVENDTIIVAEKSGDEELVLPPELSVLKERQYGVSHVLILQKNN